MAMKKILAAVLAAVMVTSFAACGSKDNTATTTEAAPETTIAVEDTTAAEAVESTEAATDTAETTEAAAETTEAATEEETTGATKKVPETKEEIVEFYKAAATATEKAKAAHCDTKMSLVSLDGGSGLVGSLISALEPIAKKALEKNSTPIDEITGGFENLTAADVASATAKDDGKYTTIKMTMKEQTDGMNGKSNEGSVGHAISVLDGVQTAIDELDGVEVDASQGSVKLLYNNATVDVKIDNATGQIVSGTWHFQVNVTIDNVVGKIAIVKATLNGAKAAIDYKVTM